MPVIPKQLESVPDVVQKQSKTVDGTARSFFKGGMGIALQNLQKMTAIGHRNAERVMNKADEAAGTSTAKPEADDMRIDSDDIQYHMHMVSGDAKPKASATSPLMGLAKIGVGAAMAGTGVGLLFALPGIISGISDLMKPPAAVQPADLKPTDTPTLNIGGQEYELQLGK